MKRNRLAIIGGGLVAAVFIAAFVASPWLAAARLTQALKTGDETALDRLVDFRSVRQSLSSQISSRIVAEAHGDEAASPFAGLVALIAPAMVDQVVAALVTPKGLAKLSRAAREAERAEDDRGEGGGDRAERPQPKPPTLAYTGLNTFAATYEVEGKGAMVWTMGRENLFFWRLKRIEITDAVFEDLELESSRD